jgi:hypothetical protein
MSVAKHAIAAEREICRAAWQNAFKDGTDLSQRGMPRTAIIEKHMQAAVAEAVQLALAGDAEVRGACAPLSVVSMEKPQMEPEIKTTPAVPQMENRVAFAQQIVHDLLRTERSGSPAQFAALAADAVYTLEAELHRQGSSKLEKAAE